MRRDSWPEGPSPPILLGMDRLRNEGWSVPLGAAPGLSWGAILDGATRPWTRRARARTIALCLISGLAIAIDALLVEPDWIEISRSIEYVPALPASAPDLTVVHLSDPHVVRMGRRERDAIAMIDGVRPDLVLVSGDLTRRGASRRDVEAFFGALRARYGVFAVWGNHDYWDGVATRWGPDALARSGVRLLKNGSVRIATVAGPIVIAGIDDPVTGHDALKQAMRGVPRRDVCVLLTHSPEVVPSLGNWDIDIVLAGHTHGGQVRLPGLGALYVPPGTRDYVEGWFDVKGGARLHVSRGLGWSWVPVRFFCRPRIDVITLRGGVPPGTRDTRSLVGRS